MGRDLNVYELRFIIRNYESMTAKEMGFYINGKHKAIHSRATNLGLKKIPNWSKKEIDFLMMVKPREASKYLSRSLASCKTKYSRLSNIKLLQAAHKK